MPNKFVKTPYDGWTYKIIGQVMAVHRKRGPGCREDTYQRDLEVHFTVSGCLCQTGCGQSKSCQRIRREEYEICPTT
jgi:hypothetical protein